MSRISVDINRGIILVRGDTEAITTVPKYVAKIVDRIASYYGYDHKEMIRELEKLIEYLKSTPYDEWLDYFKDVVPKRYAKRLIEYWLPYVISFISEVAPIVESSSWY